ncbi:hypothetical protein VZT92_019501 [Zoarces viviparus]|uniref:Uncharacterized protein n=1 Tax=Zoarces viviparus TaxID=48416 RepID=A0AAW1ELK8_ZOAVI
MKGLYHWDCNVKLAWWEWFCVSSPQTENLFGPEPQCSVSPLFLSLSAVSGQGLSPLPQSAQTLIKDQYRPGCD